MFPLWVKVASVERGVANQVDRALWQNSWSREYTLLLMQYIVESGKAVHDMARGAWACSVALGNQGIWAAFKAF